MRTPAVVVTTLLATLLVAPAANAVTPCSNCPKGRSTHRDTHSANSTNNNAATNAPATISSQ
ncbi:hypothetical protein ACFQ1S_41290, partial [Kibdelosporangium lantanae]